MEPVFLISIIAIFILLILSGFFSGSETALTGVSDPRMHSLEKDGNEKAGLVIKIREKKDKMIGALLLGNNLVNILASALATSVFIKLFGEAGVFYATFVMTMLVLIFAEVLPKTFALNYSDSMAMKIAPVVRVVIILFAPVSEMVTFIVRRVLKLMGFDVSLSNSGPNIEELKGAIELHQGPEHETQEQRAMLRSILELAEVDVGEIMIHRSKVVMIDAEQPVDKIVEKALESPFSRLPLWQGSTDNITGIIHVKWLLREIHNNAESLENINFESIAGEPWFIPENTSLYDQLQAFRQRREHIAIVVDEYGSFMGIVTLEDILEEIVGQIDDEDDISVAGVRKQPNGVYLVNGTVTIRDLNREFDWNLPDEEYSTIAGLILHEAQKLPEVGQSFTFHGFRFDIMRRHRNQITLVKVQKMGE